MRKLKDPVALLGVNGVIMVEYECDVWIFELNMTVPAMLFPGSPAVLSMGKLVKEHGFEVRWKYPNPLTLTRDEIVVQCWDQQDVPRITTGAEVATPAPETSPPTPLREAPGTTKVDAADTPCDPPLQPKEASKDQASPQQVPAKIKVPPDKAHAKAKPKAKSKSKSKYAGCMQACVLGP